MVESPRQQGINPANAPEPKGAKKNIVNSVVTAIPALIDVGPGAFIKELRGKQNENVPRQVTRAALKGLVQFAFPMTMQAIELTNRDRLNNPNDPPPRLSADERSSFMGIDMVTNLVLMLGAAHPGILAVGATMKAGAPLLVRTIYNHYSEGVNAKQQQPSVSQPNHE